MSDVTENITSPRGRGPKALSNPLDKIKRTRLEKDAYLPALEFLNLQAGTCAWRHNNDAVWMPSKGAYVRRACHQDGIPDILGVKRKSWKLNGRSWEYGQAFAFEVKRKGLLRTVGAAQRAWMQRFADCGGIAYFVDEVGEIIESFSEI